MDERDPAEVADLVRPFERPLVVGGRRGGLAEILGASPERDEDPQREQPIRRFRPFEPAEERLEGAFEDVAQPSGRVRALGGRRAERHDGAPNGHATVERLEDRRARHQAAVDQRCAAHLDGRKQARDGDGRDERVERDRLVVEAPRLAAGEVGRHNDETRR